MGFEPTTQTSSGSTWITAISFLNATTSSVEENVYNTTLEYWTTTLWGENGSNPSQNISFLSGTIPYTFSVILIVLYTVTALAAVVGNSLAIIVFARGKRSNTDLRLFLINLAMADLIMAIVCIPFTFAYQITENWIFSEVMCPIVISCQQVSVTASVSTNTAIGIDRLIAVRFPLRRRVTSSRSKLVILGIWVFAWSLGVVPLVKSQTLPQDGKLKCEEIWTEEQSRLAYGFFIMIITYFLPVTVLSVTYTMIGRQLWKHKLPGNADDHRDAVQIKSKRKVVKMLATIVFLFGVCWLPLHVFIIIFTFKSDFFGKAGEEIYFGVHWLSMANSFVNPVIYGFMNENFRADLASMVQSCFCHHWGHKRLKYRTAAMRWRLGDCNVHDVSNMAPHCCSTKSLTRHQMGARAGRPAPRKHWKNGHVKCVSETEVSDICTCDHVLDLDCGHVGHHAGNGSRTIFLGGKRRKCEGAHKQACLGEENGLFRGGHRSELSRVRPDSVCDSQTGVFYDGSDVVLLKEHHRKEPG